MMRLFLVLVLVLAACSSEDTESEPPTSAPPESSTTTLPPTSTTTTAPDETTTTAIPTTTLAELRKLSYELVADVDFPVQVIPGPEDEIAYVVAKAGIVHALVDGQLQADPVLNISDLVRDSGEQGLLAAVVHPNDPTLLFVHYSGGSGETVLSEYQLTSPLLADRATARVLLTLDQPASNHNGGMIQFSEDGRLIIALGDGGGANDRFGNGQDTSTLLGGLTAVDVDSGETELFAHGLRNPWRFWIDDGSIYIADVGQGSYEEVSVVAFEPGHNFGWPIMEGLHCFSPSSGCDMSGLVLPVVEVSHSDSGTCSISGGVVYRGVQIPEIEGRYFYSDYCGGYLRSFVFVDGEATEMKDWTEQVGIPGRVTGFGTDPAGEMYVTTETQVLKVVAER